ncbi:hypothetical protein EIP86_011011 [Pleurotus ostreatoroseus]|nr:hypothetical protein EIP86_011011 [Pleurotus ostreatoroseus]
MQADDTAHQHDDLDVDSLFGSPPPSPGRGRSPSPVPLAWPSGQDMSQNVGTLALPGSHLCSELPPALPPAPPVAAGPRPRPPLPSRTRQPPQDRSTTLAQGTKPRPAPGPSHKKRPSRRSTSVVEAPPIQLPSPDEPLPPNFLRNQDALLGRAGLVAGVRPADLAFQRSTRGQSPSNPIIVEDEAEQPMIGRRPLASRLPPHGANVKPPSYEEIIQSLVRQKNLVPILHALLRVVTGSAQLGPYSSASTATSHTTNPPSTSTSYPYYPSQAYPYGTYYPPPHAYDPSYASNSRAPKRRRLSTVPAGAGDWDVPYPFAEGQGPPNYRTNWEKERGRQLVEDLVSLVKCAARKAAAKKVVDGATGSETKQEPLELDEYPIGSVEYYRERVLSHYRPQTYGYESGQFQYPNWSGSHAQAGPSNATYFPPVSRARASTTSALSFPPTSAAPASSDSSSTTAQAPIAGLSSAGQRSASALPPEPVTDSSVTAQPVLQTMEERSHSEPPLPSNCHPPPASFPSENAQENPQANIDDFLSFINNLPSSDLDALFSTEFPSIPAAEEGSAASSGSTVAEDDISMLFNLDPDAFAIDPALLALPNPGELDTVDGSGSAELASVAGDGPSQTQTPTQVPSAPESVPAAPPTPTLVGSPVSLSDLDPPTPSWDFPFPEPAIVGGGDADGGGCGASNGVGPNNASEGIGRSAVSVDLRRLVLTRHLHAVSEQDQDQGQSGRAKEKGKARATEVDRMDVDGSVQRAWLPTASGSTTPSAWRSEPTTASTSVVTSRQSTPGPSALPPAVVQPAAQPPPPPSVQTQAPTQATPAPCTSYAHHLPPFLNLPPHGVAGARYPRPAGTVRAKAPDREDVMNRARAMRAQLVGEIERAKVELWETTMEGGCLSTLSKDLDRMVEQWNQSRADAGGTGAGAS